ncbi:unnamed protein product [Closterium sp. Naga37s-1]|nr:unnamed protein product [Closterium sp. Naga37s-1]
MSEEVAVLLSRPAHLSLPLSDLPPYLLPHLSSLRSLHLSLSAPHHPLLSGRPFHSLSRLSLLHLSLGSPTTGLSEPLLPDLAMARADPLPTCRPTAHMQTHCPHADPLPTCRPTAPAAAHARIDGRAAAPDPLAIHDSPWPSHPPMHAPTILPHLLPNLTFLRIHSPPRAPLPVLRHLRTLIVGSYPHSSRFLAALSLFPALTALRIFNLSTHNHHSALACPPHLKSLQIFHSLTPLLPDCLRLFSSLTRLHLFQSTPLRALPSFLSSLSSLTHLKLGRGYNPVVVPVGLQGYLQGRGWAREQEEEQKRKGHQGRKPKTDWEIEEERRRKMMFQSVFEGSEASGSNHDLHDQRKLTPEEVPAGALQHPKHSSSSNSEESSTPNGTQLLQLPPAVLQGMLQLPPVVLQGMLQLPPAVLQGVVQLPPAVLQGVLQLPPAVLQGVVQLPPAVLQGVLQLPPAVLQGVVQRVQSPVDQGRVRPPVCSSHSMMSHHETRAEAAFSGSPLFSSSWLPSDSPFWVIHSSPTSSSMLPSSYPPFTLPPPITLSSLSTCLVPPLPSPSSLAHTLANYPNLSTLALPLVSTTACPLRPSHLRSLLAAAAALPALTSLSLLLEPGFSANHECGYGRDDWRAAAGMERKVGRWWGEANQEMERGLFAVLKRCRRTHASSALPLLPLRPPPLPPIALPACAKHPQPLLPPWGSWSSVSDDLLLGLLSCLSSLSLHLPVSTMPSSFSCLTSLTCLDTNLWISGLEDAEQGLVVEDAEQGLVVEDAEQGLVVEDAEQGLVVEDAEQGLVVEDAEQGMVGWRRNDEEWRAPVCQQLKVLQLVTSGRASIVDMSLDPALEHMALAASSYVAWKVGSGFSANLCFLHLDRGKLSGYDSEPRLTQLTALTTLVVDNADCRDFLACLSCFSSLHTLRLSNITRGCSEPISRARLSSPRFKSVAATCRTCHPHCSNPHSSPPFQTHRRWPHAQCAGMPERFSHRKGLV